MLNVRDFGAGNGNATQDTQAFKAAAAMGGPVFVPSGRYLLLDRVVFRDSVVGEGRSSVIVGTGSGNNDDRQVSISSDLGEPRAASGALAVGPFGLTLDDASGLIPGDTVLLWLGIDPTDATLPLVLVWNRIKAVSGNLVTFCEPLPEPVGAGPHKLYKPLTVADGVEVAGLAFERDVASGNRGYNALGLAYTRNAHAHDLTFKDMGYCSVIPVYTEGTTIERVFTDRSTYDAAKSNTTGGFIQGWTNRNMTIRQVVGRDIGGIGFFFEGQNRNVVVDGFSISCGQDGAAFPLMCNALGRSRQVSYRNGELWSKGARFALSGQWDTSENLLLHGENLHCMIDRHSGALSYGGYTAGRKATFVKDFAVQSNMAGVVPWAVPAGWYAAVRVQVSHTQGIQNMALLANGGSGGSFQGQLVANEVVGITAPGRLFSLGPRDEAPFNFNPQGGFLKMFILTTDGTVPAGATARLEIDYWPVSA